MKLLLSLLITALLLSACGSPADPTAPAAPPASATPAAPAATLIGQPGSIEGVFISRQTSTSPEGTPCFYLYRFYADGMVLQSGICDAAIAQSWPKISEWFHRDSQHEIGKGEYVNNGGQLQFSTTARTTGTQSAMVIEFAGAYDGERLLGKVQNHGTGEAWEQLEFSRLVI